MIGIICGGGDYPHLVIKTCQEQKREFCLVFVNGYDKSIDYPDVPRFFANLGRIGEILHFLKLHEVTQIIFAGRIVRPSLFDLSFDMTGFKWALRLLKELLFCGDDALLRKVAELVHEQGLQVISGDKLFRYLFLSEGIYTKVAPSKSDMEDIRIGISAALHLGLQDIGQAVVVSDGKIIAKEDVRGTDAMIGRCYEGILVKLSKPQQDLRMDLPTIGLDTIENLHNHGYRGAVIEDNKTIVLDKETVIQKANEYGLFLQVVKVRHKRKVFIMAGEASGDYLGGRLMKDIKKLDEDTEFCGIGGSYMEQVGIISLFSISELSLIGIKEVIGKIWHVWKLIRKTARTIKYYQPDVIIGIDSSGFTHRVYKAVKRMGVKAPVIHYVAPPVWAWRKWRAARLHKFIDKLLVLFPFEKEIFSKNNLDTAFVGHPVMVDNDFVSQPEECKQIGVTLLPGSRASELELHMPVLKKFVELFSLKYPEAQFFLPTTREMAPLIKKFVSGWSVKPIVSTKKLKKVKAYNSSKLAVAASGTVTLELTKMNLPFVVIYKTSEFTYRLVKWLIHVPYICLVNILSHETVVPELIQDDCTAENLMKHAENLLKSQEQQRQQFFFQKIRSQLTVARSIAAEEVLGTIKNRETEEIASE